MEAYKRRGASSRAYTKRSSFWQALRALAIRSQNFKSGLNNCDGKNQALAICAAYIHQTIISAKAFGD